MTVQIEQRHLARPLEVRKDGDSLRLEGYAAVFYAASDPDGTQYRLFRDTWERVMPGAFDEALRRPDDVRCLFNHNMDAVLGRTVSKTLALSVDAIGLRYSCLLPDDEDGRRVASKVSRGDVTGCSFAFSVEKQNWREDKEVTYREILSVRLYDVGPVTFPAYKATDVSVAQRSLGEFRASHKPQRTLAGIERSRMIAKLTK